MIGMLKSIDTRHDSYPYTGLPIMFANTRLIVHTIHDFLVQRSCTSGGLALKKLWVPGSDWQGCQSANGRWAPKICLHFHALRAPLGSWMGPLRGRRWHMGPKKFYQPSPTLMIAVGFGGPLYLRNENFHLTELLNLCVVRSNVKCEEIYHQVMQPYSRSREHLPPVTSILVGRRAFTTS